MGRAGRLHQRIIVERERAVSQVSQEQVRCHFNVLSGAFTAEGMTKFTIIILTSMSRVYDTNEEVWMVRLWSLALWVAMYVEQC